MKPVAAFMLAAVLGSAAAQPPAPPQTQTQIEQHLGAELPLALPFTAADGGAVRLRDYFDGERAVVLVLGYYRCPNLCGLVMHGVLEALAASGLRRDDYRLLGVSIDPGETAADARSREHIYADYAAQLGGLTPELHLLVGEAQAIDALARSVGFEYVRDATAAASASRYAHAGGIVVVTPEGRLSRYLFGVRFDARELRLAVVEAASGRIGALAERLLLMCAHFDPRLGRHSEAVMNLLRASGLALVLALGGYAWQRRR